MLFTVTMLRLVEAFKVLGPALQHDQRRAGRGHADDSFYIYLTGLRNFNQGYASAMAYLLLIVMVIIASIFFRRMRGEL